MSETGDKDLKRKYNCVSFMILVYFTLDKRGISGNYFLNSPQKHMLWVLIRSASMRHF